MLCADVHVGAHQVDALGVDGQQQIDRCDDRLGLECERRDVRAQRAQALAARDPDGVAQPAVGAVVAARDDADNDVVA